MVGSVFGEPGLERFQIFWGVGWFTVVKGWHATEFGILTLGLIYSLNSLRMLHQRSRILAAAGLAVVFAASDEFHQTFVAGRGGTVTDVLIDAR